MEPVRWGVLSTARIGTTKVIPGMQKSPALVVLGVASRDLSKAQHCAAELGVARAYGSYEEMLADPDIEAVYNPLPNDLHVPLTLAAVRAGKHVLCEKPMAMTAVELEALRPFTSKVHIREAFMVRHHPQWIESRRLIREGAIGELRYIHAAFNYFNTDPQNIRNRPENGGGALFDIGCYAVTAGRWFFEGEANRVIATIDRDPVFGTDRTTSGMLEFSEGRHLTFSVSTQAAPYQRVTVAGTRGRLEIAIPFNAPPDRPCTFTIDSGGALDGSTAVQTTVNVADQYQLQAESFSRAVRGERPNASGLDDASATLRTIDALFTSARSGRFEQL